MIQIYDFEATDLIDPKATQIGQCRLAKDYRLIKSSCKSHYINPEKEISWGAMGITGITNEMVQDKPTFDKVIDWYKVHPDTKYVVCHNMSFDSRLFPEGFIPEGVRTLCTLKLAQKLIPKTECDNHQNATLFYYLGCYKNPFGKEHITKTHDAIADVLITANGLTALLETFNITIDEAYDIVNDVTTCRFPKYSKIKWIDIIKTDYSYCEYQVENQDWDNEDELSYVKQLLEEYKHVKDDQLKICSFKKYQGQSWEKVVEQDLSYVQWMLDKGNIKGDEEVYVRSLIK